MPSSQLQKRTPRVELVCPAGTLPALRAAVDHGADAVHIGFRGETNARNFPGLNFTPKEARTGLDYAHTRGARVFVALNVYPSPHSWPMSVAAVDCAAALGVDALILADPGLMAYAADRYPALRLHLSVQASATNWRAIEFYRREFSIHRAVLPRVLSCTQVARLIERASVEIEVFGFGSLCVMVEGRCALSSYVTGQSPNTHGVCPCESRTRQSRPQDRCDYFASGIVRMSMTPQSVYTTIGISTPMNNSRNGLSSSCCSRGGCSASSFLFISLMRSPSSGPRKKTGIHITLPRACASRREGARWTEYFPRLPSMY
jgi:O2-independent ubiquinone biosynthesis protein UbiU